MSFKAIIFDMDGVLIDSLDIVTESFNHALKKYNVKLTDNYRRNQIGLSLKDQIKLWEKDFNIKIDFKSFSDDSLKIQEELSEKKIKPNKYLLEFIKILKKSKIKVAVATSSQKIRAIGMLKLIDVYNKIDSLVTA